MFPPIIYGIGLAFFAFFSSGCDGEKKGKVAPSTPPPLPTSPTDRSVVVSEKDTFCAPLDYQNPQEFRMIYNAQFTKLLNNAAKNFGDLSGKVILTDSAYRNANEIIKKAPEEFRKFLFADGAEALVDTPSDAINLVLVAQYMNLLAAVTPTAPSIMSLQDAALVKALREKRISDQELAFILRKTRIPSNWQHPLFRDSNSTAPVWQVTTPLTVDDANTNGASYFKYMAKCKSYFQAQGVSEWKAYVKVI